jgi:hypothetical protein
VGRSLSSARRQAAVVALAALVLATVAGVLAQRDRPLAVPKDAAIARSLTAAPVRDAVRAGDRATVYRVDDGLEKVVWYRDGRAIASAGVRRTGLIDAQRIGDRTGWGAEVGHAALVLAIGTLLFLLVVLRAPLRARLRTLDAVAVAALAAPVVLIDHGRYALAEGVVAALLLYLMARWSRSAGRTTPPTPTRPSSSTPSPPACARRACPPSSVGRSSPSP